MVKILVIKKQWLYLRLNINQDPDRADSRNNYAIQE